MRIRKSYRLPAVTVEKIEWLEQILPAENQTHVIELAVAHLWQAERNKRLINQTPRKPGGVGKGQQGDQNEPK